MCGWWWWCCCGEAELCCGEVGEKGSLLQCGGGGVVRTRVVLVAYQDHQIIEHLDLENKFEVVSASCSKIVLVL